ncbi:transglutaminase-like domain-containing protein [Hymenobacter lutimineralis]|nr:transglutaminase domain-containing protein [Hymenobacter lutimineralis]
MHSLCFQWRGLLAALLWLMTLPQLTTAQSTARARTFIFEYQATVPIAPAKTRQVDLWLPVAHSDAAQDVQILQIDAPGKHKATAGQHGNQLLHLRLRQPKAPTTVLVRYQVTRREHRAPQPAKGRIPMQDPDSARWLAPDRLVPLDDQIRRWAREVVSEARAETPLEQARAVYNHVVATVKYDKTGQGWGRGDIYYACDARHGNCTDFHALFIGYCRALGIPARFSIGFPLPPERGTGEVKGYHCWAEFYTPQTGWVPIDASEAAKNPDRREYYFGAHDENRVEFTRGRDLTLEPAQQALPLNYFIYPYAEADGKPLEGVQHSFRYQDVLADEL